MFKNINIRITDTEINDIIQFAEYKNRGRFYKTISYALISKIHLNRKNYVKSIDKSIVTVFGGTNYPYDIYNQKLFHKKRPNLDIHTFYEGEKSFSKIVGQVA